MSNKDKVDEAVSEHILLQLNSPTVPKYTIVNWLMELIKSMKLIKFNTQLTLDCFHVLPLTSGDTRMFHAAQCDADSAEFATLSRSHFGLILKILKHSCI